MGTSVFYFSIPWHLSGWGQDLSLCHYAVLLSSHFPTGLSCTVKFWLIHNILSFMHKQHFTGTDVWLKASLLHTCRHSAHMQQKLASWRPGNLGIILDWLRIMTIVCLPTKLSICTYQSSVVPTLMFLSEQMRRWQLTPPCWFISLARRERLSSPLSITTGMESVMWILERNILHLMDKFTSSLFTF